MERSEGDSACLESNQDLPWRPAQKQGANLSSVANGRLETQSFRTTYLSIYLPDWDHPYMDNADINLGTRIRQCSILYEKNRFTAINEHPSMIDALGYLSLCAG